MNLVTVPAHLAILNKVSLPDLPHATSIVFEPGSIVRRLDRYTFGCCQSLKSICIAASVEEIAHTCFAGYGESSSPIETITFEPGSKLHTIEDWAFRGCHSLNLLSLPGSVRLLRGSSFGDCRCPRIEIEATNPDFHMDGDFLMDSKELKLVRYSGTSAEVTVPDTVESLGGLCFGYCKSVRVVTFSSESRLRSIEDGAFAECGQLESIFLPPSLESIGNECLCDCVSLAHISFGANSHLRSMGDRIFYHCRSLKSICLPAALEEIPPSALAFCAGLVSVTFAPGCRVTAIRQQVFFGCEALASFCVPSSVQIIDFQCFVVCERLRDLTFASPSHLRDLLDLPAKWNGGEIPDSVELLVFTGGPYIHYTLLFGPQSRLTSFNARLVPFGSAVSFLRVPARALKGVRETLEFARR
jgi:hypothetical protein